MEKYLAKCIKSIINQTYQNIEIVCIDDGGTDSSGAILDELATSDGRIVAIHQSNTGLIGVRKNGVSVAKGELIAFVDSDDYVDEHLIEALYNNMREHNSDIAVCGFDIVDEDGAILSQITLKNHSEDSGKALRGLIYEDFAKTGLYPMWNKLYKKELFTKIEFPAGNFNLGEDQYQNLQLIDNAVKVSFAEGHFYSYVQRAGSIMKSMKLEYIQSFFSLLKLKRELILKYDMQKTDAKKVFDNYFSTIFDLYGFAYRSGNKECIEFFNAALVREEFFAFSNLPLSVTNLLRAVKFGLRRYF